MARYQLAQSAQKVVDLPPPTPREYGATQHKNVFMRNFVDIWSPSDRRRIVTSVCPCYALSTDLRYRSIALRYRSIALRCRTIARWR